MVSQFGIKLAVHLITNHFGNLVAKVCEKLLCIGPLPLEQLIRYTELTKEQVKNSLLVLVQHNCAQAFVLEGGDVDGLKERTQYLALFDNILHRLRFPKFMEIVSQELDDECVELLDGLLRDGRLTLKQMVDRASEGKVVGTADDLCNYKNVFGMGQDRSVVCIGLGLQEWYNKHDLAKSVVHSERA